MSQIQREIHHFNNLEHIWWGARTPAGQIRYNCKANLFKQLCHPNSKTKILEIGCGDGEFTRRLLQTKARIIATDVTPSVVDRGRQLLRRPRLQFRLANCEKLPFTDQSFDIVCGISILHHVHPKKALTEAYRVLKPGGQIFFTEPNLYNPNIYLILHIGYLRRLCEQSPDETALVRWQTAKLLQGVGFSNIQVKNYDFLHPLTPASLVPFITRVSSILENLPLIKEISGSLLIYAKK